MSDLPGETQEEVPGSAMSWFLSADELAATRAKMAKLSRRAASKGFTGDIQVMAVAATRSHTPAPGAASVTLHGFDVTITGSAPSYGGWRFLAAADTVPGTPPDQLRIVEQEALSGKGAGSSHVATGEGSETRLTHQVVLTPVPDQLGMTIAEFDLRGDAEEALRRFAAPTVLLRLAPGSEGLVDRESIRPGECDHCHTVRPRSSVLIVRNEDTKETKQVGRSCVKDFLGWNTYPVFIDLESAAKQIAAGGAREGYEVGVSDGLCKR